MRTHWNRTRLLAACLMLAAPALAGPALPPADVVLEWNAIMVSAVGAQNPFAQGRIAAITQLAVFEAVNAITRQYTPYLDELAALPGASADAAAIAAAHRVLTTYVPAAAASLDAARDRSLGGIADGAAKANGIALGQAAADAMIAARAGDGAAPPEFHQPPSLDPGEWQPTPSCPAAGGVLKHWGRVRPFGIPDVTLFRSPPPPPLTSGRYARDLNEVKEVGGVASTSRPQAKSDIARFYNAVLAVGVWNPVVSELAGGHRLSLTQRARILALLNMAISDGLVAVMETKYEYTLWRPETAIQQAAGDGNRHTEPDAAFQPFILTPCFPSYGSAHAAASYAARAVAESVFGEHFPEVVLSSPAVPGVTLSYISFEEITDDIDDARVYGGIHFRFDQRAGAAQGRRIGQWIHNHALRATRRAGH